MERRANLARQALEDGDVAGRLPDRGAELRRQGARLCRLRVGGGLHRADPAGRPRRARSGISPASRRRCRRRSASGAPATGWGSPHEAAGDAAAAQSAFRPARAHQTSFYGQLAAEELASPAGSRGSPASGAAPDWRKAPFMQLLGGEGGLLPAPAPATTAGVAVLPPRRRGPAAPRRARRWRRWRSTSGGRRSASASPRTPPPRGSSCPTSTIRCTPIGRRRTGRCRPST